MQTGMDRRADVFVLLEKGTVYCVCVCVCLCVCVCVCVCMCVREREREREIVCIFLCLQPTESAACLADVFNIS